MAKELVTKSNSLINASYYLDLGEWRLITASAALARKAGIEITADKELFLSVKDFANLYDLDRTRAYTVLRSACDTLFERQISYLETLNGKKMISRTRWVHKISYCAGLKTFRKRRTGIFDHTCRSDPCSWLGDPVYL